ncbi:MAG: Fur family transcriptional regulator [Kiloniellaceae bacterium]
MTIAMPEDLTHNQAIVLDCLIEAGRAMTAYQLLDELRDNGLRAPAQIYRALSVLARRDLIHRIESLNAFVACRHGDHSEIVAFAICDDCRTIWEFTLPRDSSLNAKADSKGFTINSAIVELHGRCAECKETRKQWLGH